jgi:hypothetical protein
MSEKETGKGTAGGEGNGEAGRKRNSRQGVTPDDKRLYATLEEARANRPEGKENWWLWQITDPAGEHRWTWAPHGERAMWHVVEADDWTVIDVESVPSKAEVAAQIAALSPEDRAALLARYLPAASAPAPAKGKGK